MMLTRMVPVSPTTMPALPSMVTTTILPAVLPVLVIPLVPKMLTGVPDGKVNLGASLRAPLARRHGSTASVARPPCPPRAGAARRARLARPGRLRASPRTVAAALRASPVPASPRTAARSRAAAAPLRRVPRRRFPKPRCCRFGRPDRRGGLGSHTPRICDALHDVAQTLLEKPNSVSQQDLALFFPFNPLLRSFEHCRPIQDTILHSVGRSGARPLSFF